MESLIRLPPNDPRGAALTAALGRLMEESLTAVVAPATAAAVLRDGWERLHRHLAAEEIARFNERVNGRLAREVVTLVGRFLGRRAFVATLPVLRFYLPEDRRARDGAVFARRPFYTMRVHNPHLDSWFDFPESTMNIWIALTAVPPESAMLLYPEAPPPPRRPEDPDRFPAAFPLGRPVPVPVDKGGVLVFPGEVLHGTSLNTGESTRVSVTLRYFDARPPATFFRYARYERRLDALGLAGPFGRLDARVRERRFRAGLRLRSAASSLRWRLVGLGLLPRPPLPPRPSPERHRLRPGADIHVLSDDFLLVKRSGGRVRVSRRCPHRGADLAGGYVDGGCLRCPWHNLGFDLKTGRSPCRSVRPLEVSEVPGPRETAETDLPASP